jgi:hypothetical protein
VPVADADRTDQQLACRGRGGGSPNQDKLRDDERLDSSLEERDTAPVIRVDADG